MSKIIRYFSYKKFKENEDFRTKTLLIFVLFIYILFGSYHFTKFVSADEHFWLYNPENDRIHQYWQAIQDRDWEDTRINDKPGITLAYTAGIGVFFEKDPEKQVLLNDGTVKIFDPAKTEEINLLYRLPIFVLTLLFSFFFFWIIKKITQNSFLALWAVSLIYLSPIIIGISQIVNPDSTFWIFAFSTILSFFAFLKFRERKFILLSTIFFGLSLASKYVGIILIPFMFFMSFFYYIFNFEDMRKSAKSFSKRIFFDSLSYFGIIAGGLFIFSLMMPAVFVKSKYFYQGTIGFPGMEPIFWTIVAINILVILDAAFNKSKILSGIIFFLNSFDLKKILIRSVSIILLATFLFILINWLVRHSFVDMSEIPFDLKRSAAFYELPVLTRFVMEAVPLVFSLTPVVLFAFLYLLVRSLFKNPKQELLYFLFCSFIIIFYIAVMKQGLLLTIRYSIILYPIAITLSAMAFSEFFDDFKDMARKNYPLKVFSILSAIITFFFILSQIGQYFSADDRIVYLFDQNRILSFVVGFLSVSFFYYIYFRILTWFKKINLGRELAFPFLIILSVISLWLIKPFYFNYDSELLPKKYIISAAWGYGGYEAAQYLNSLPNAKNLTVWVDMYGTCEFFVGKCIHKAKVKTEKYKIDYYVRTLKGSLSPNFYHPMEDDPSWELTINGHRRNFIKIYKALPN